MLEKQEKNFKPPEIAKQNLIDLVKSKPQAEALEASLPDILSLNKEQFAYGLKFLSKYPYRDELSKEFIEQILKRGLELSQITIDEKYLDFDEKILFDMDFALCQPNLNFKKNHPDKLTITDKAMLAFPACYLEFPDALIKFWDLFYQSNTITMRPEILLNVLKEMNADPRVDNYWRGYNIGILKEKIGYDGYEEIIKKDLLNKDNPTSFQAQLSWLKFLRQIFVDIYIHEIEPSEEYAFNNLIDIFESSIKKLPNRLLREYLRHILEDEITPLHYDRYLKLDEKNKPHFYDAEMAPEDEAERLTEESHYSPTQLANMRLRRQIDFGVKKISSDFFGAVDKYGLKYILDKDDNLHSLEDVLTENLRVDMDVLAKEEIIANTLDFSVLTDPFFKNLIKKEMQIDLLDLDLQTQFWFLDFLKNADDEKFVRVSKFAQNFQTAGIKTFLAMEYDEKNGQKILDIAESMPEDEAKRIFNDYSLLIDQSIAFGQELQSIFSNQELNKTEKNFPINFGEAIRRRANDLFLALGDNALHTEFSSNDIDMSVQANNLLINILADFKTQHKFSFVLTKKEKNTLKSIPENHEQKLEYLLTNKENGLQYIFRVFLRPFANQRGEARISFTIAFIGNGVTNEDQKMKDFFTQTIHVKKTGQEKINSQFCLRLDRDKENYTQPLMSLDMGGFTREDIKRKYSGDKLGNMLHKISPAGHHNPDSFPAVFGDENNFAKLSNVFFNYFVNEPEKWQAEKNKKEAA